MSNRHRSARSERSGRPDQATIPERPPAGRPVPGARRSPTSRSPSPGWGPGTTVATPADLATLWRALIAPDRFAERHGSGGEADGPLPEPDRRRVWMIFLDDADCAQPTVFPVENLPAEPDPRFLSALGDIVVSLVADGLASSVPVLLERPGPAAMTESDRRWARALRTALGRPALRWPIHLATHAGIRPFAPDDLLVGAD